MLLLRINRFNHSFFPCFTPLLATLLALGVFLIEDVAFGGVMGADVSTSLPEGVGAGFPQNLTPRNSGKEDNSAMPASGAFNLTTGLVVAYRFDEGKGSSTDALGSRQAGTLFNTDWIMNPKHGYALRFNGINSYISAPADGMPATNASQTIAYWLFLNSRETTRQSVVSLYNRDQQISIQIGLKDAMAGVWQHNGSWLVIGTQPSAGKWHHYAYTYDGQTHRLYLDGAEVSNSTVAPKGVTVKDFEIGRGWGNSEYLRGTVDEVRIYNRALSPAEIENLVEASTGNSVH